MDVSTTLKPSSLLQFLLQFEQRFCCNCYHPLDCEMKTFVVCAVDFLATWVTVIIVSAILSVISRTKRWTARNLLIVSLFDSSVLFFFVKDTETTREVLAKTNFSWSLNKITGEVEYNRKKCCGFPVTLLTNHGSLHERYQVAVWCMIKIASKSLVETGLLDQFSVSTAR